MNKHGGRALALGAVLGLTLLAACGSRALGDFAFIAEGDRVLASVGFSPSLDSTITRHVAAYVAKLVLVHLAFGCLAALFAVLLRSAFPRLRVSLALLTCAAFSVMTGFVLTANSAWFPASTFSFLSRNPDGLPGLQFQTVTLDILGGLLLATVSAAAIVALIRHRRRIRTRFAGSAAALVVICVAVAGSLAGLKLTAARGDAASANGTRPNVIIVGIDSLRNDIPLSRTDPELTPRIAGFLADSHVFTDTISPLARTYPSWVSILTGKHPVNSNARFNLMPRARVDATETLGFDLKALGYQTLYATDEVRFANIDGSFGFDRVITPPIGAMDFILGSFNDLPLPNVVSRTSLGKWLFPHTYGNRAAHVTYRPEMFDEALQDALDVDQPALVAVHLTLAHFPYSWAGAPRPSTPDQYRSSYRTAISEVDAQFGRLMDMLETRGLLQNAIVVVLSDHGEALGGEHDTMLRSVVSPDQIWSSVWGHGTSVMSPHQYQVVLAFREFGQYRGMSEPASHDVPASLEDLRPTLVDLVASNVPRGVDGVSLAGILRGHPATSAIEDRVRFTETDFNTPSVLEGKYDVDGALREGAAYYEVDNRSGWVQLKPGRLGELLSSKERAAMYRSLHLAALPGRDGETTYLLTEAPGSPPMRLAGRPDPGANPPASFLWDALHSRFPGELSGGS